MKKQLYDAVIPKWHDWTKNYPLSIDDVIMRNNNWVRLVPRNPDCDIISDQFFKRGKKGVIFKTGKCIINLHVPNHIYTVVVAQKEADEVDDIDHFEGEGKVAVIQHQVVAADFTVRSL